MSTPTQTTPVTSRKLGNGYSSSSGNVDWKNYGSPKSSPRITPKFRIDGPKGVIKHNGFNSPLSNRKQFNLVMSPEAARKKCVSFSLDNGKSSPTTSPRLPPISPSSKIKHKSKTVFEGYDDHDNLEDGEVRLPQRRPLPATSDIFKQALGSLDADSDMVATTGNSALPGDLHVRRSSLLLAMTELQLASLHEKMGKEQDDFDDEDIGREDDEIISLKSSISPIPIVSSERHSGDQLRLEQQTHLKQPPPRVRKVSAPSKMQHSPKMAWKSPDSSSKSSPLNSPMLKRRALSVTNPPKLNELDTSKHKDRLTETTNSGLPKIGTLQIEATRQPVESSGLRPNSSPKLHRPKIASTLKDMQTITKYIQLASVGAGVQSTPPDMFGFYNDNNSQVLSPRQTLVRRGLTGKGGWLHDGLGDIMEVTTFDELKGCRYIRRRRSSTYNEI